MHPPAPNARHDLLIARRNLKMATSPHAYVRGNTVQYYEWLHSQRGHALPHGPPVWICGDCHLGNLGPIGAADGDVELAIRDLDQTTVGNPAHDLVRLALSLAMAARGSSLPGVVTAHMLEHMMQGYEQAFISGPHEPHKRPEAVRWVMRKAVQRNWTHLASDRLAGKQPSIPLGKKFWPLSADEKKAITVLFKNPDVLTLVTTLKSRDDDAPVQLLDDAYWVKGCSSLGLMRYAALLSVGEGDEREHCLIDIKQAVKAAAPRHNHAHIPRDNAHRVVAGARALSPALGERMIAQRFLDHGVFLRELLPQDLKLDIDELTLDDSKKAAHYLAYIVGQAHARQMDDATRERWSAELRRDHSSTLAAPTWLWKSLLQLIASHEAGYLEHCRKYALDG